VNKITKLDSLIATAARRWQLKGPEGIETGFKNEKHRGQWRTTLTTYAAPIWDKRLVDIETDDVLACLKPIWQTKAETASTCSGKTLPHSPSRRSTAILRMFPAGKVTAHKAPPAIYAAAVQVVQLVTTVKGLSGIAVPAGEDVSFWLEQGHTKEELLERHAIPP